MDELGNILEKKIYLDCTVYKTEKEKEEEKNLINLWDKN